MYIVYIDSMEWQLFAIQGLLCQSRHIRDIHSEDVTASQPGSLIAFAYPRCDNSSAAFPGRWGLTPCGRIQPSHAVPLFSEVQQDVVSERYFMLCLYT